MSKNRIVYYKKGYIYYDGDELFEAYDDYGNCYIALLISNSKRYDKYKYLVIELTVERLKYFLDSKIDLLSLILEREKDEWFVALINDYTKPIILKKQNKVLSKMKKYLPESGFYMGVFISNGESDLAEPQED